MSILKSETNYTVLPALNYCWAEEHFESLCNYRMEKQHAFNSGIVAKKTRDTTRPLNLKTTSEDCSPLIFFYSKAFFFIRAGLGRHHITVPVRQNECTTSNVDTSLLIPKFRSSTNRLQMKRTFIRKWMMADFINIFSWKIFFSCFKRNILAKPNFLLSIPEEIPVCIYLYM